MYCLDTNIIIDILEGEESVKKKFEIILNSGEEIYITPITLCELYKGAYLFFNQKEEVEEIEDFVSSFILLNFGEDACREYGRIYASLKKSGKMSEEADLMIASVVKVNDLILVTRNKKHFENTGVKLEIW